MAIAHGDEVAAVAAERDAAHLARDLVRGHLKPGPVVPQVDHHVVDGADGDEQVVGARIRREAHALDGELVAGELAELHFLAHVPHTHFWVVATLRKIK